MLTQDQPELLIQLVMYETNKQYADFVKNIDQISL